MRKSVVLFVFLALVVFAFRSLPELISWPSYFPKPVYDFQKRPLTAAQIELGRVLFYDPVLSVDSSTSCASCHSPYNAFAHTDHALSHGIHDSIGTRNAPALMNLAWNRLFMWDGAVNHIEAQPLAPISNGSEMGEEINHVVFKLSRSLRYRRLFYTAYGDSVVTGQRTLLALAQFQLNLISCNSKYDSVRMGNAAFNAQEQRGYDLFLLRCNFCHTEPLFTNGDFVNNGLPIDTNLNDPGRYAITHSPSDSLKFKVPSLRNVEFTYPYMHDGRFSGLYQVLNHYTSGITNSTTLAPQLKVPLMLSASEKTDLVAFLLTLSDKKIIFDTRYGPPQRPAK
jgi:cytochrome c peroxidase